MVGSPKSFKKTGALKRKLSISRNNEATIDDIPANQVKEATLGSISPDHVDSNKKTRSCGKVKKVPTVSASLGPVIVTTNKKILASD